MVAEPLVLIVEDEMLVRGTLGTTLREAGFRVLEASGAEDALKLLASTEDIRLLFTDINLKSEIDGFELARRARDGRPGIAILFTSGARGMRERAIEQGDGFLPKPYSPLDVVYQVVGLTQ